MDETKAAKKNLEIELKDTSKEFKKQLDLIEKRITKALVLEKKVELKSKHMEAHSGNALEEHLKTSKKRWLGIYFFYFLFKYLILFISYVLNIHENSQVLKVKAKTRSRNGRLLSRGKISSYADETN